MLIGTFAHFPLVDEWESALSFFKILIWILTQIDLGSQSV